eukprot:scaffold8536_cov36-Cyclotella_meneghiniana.AAC.7
METSTGIWRGISNDWQMGTLTVMSKGDVEGLLEGLSDGDFDGDLEGDFEGLAAMGTSTVLSKDC